LAAELVLELFCLCMRLRKQWRIAVGMRPETEELPVRIAGLGGFVLHGERAAKVKPGERNLLIG
jgi:hypothetical protein